MTSEWNFFNLHRNSFSPACNLLYQATETTVKGNAVTMKASRLRLSSKGFSPDRKRVWIPHRVKLVISQRSFVVSVRKAAGGKMFIEFIFKVYFSRLVSAVGRGSKKWMICQVLWDAEQECSATLIFPYIIKSLMLSMHWFTAEWIGQGKGLLQKPYSTILTWKNILFVF